VSWFSDQEDFLFIHHITYETLRDMRIRTLSITGGKLRYELIELYSPFHCIIDIRTDILKKISKV